jgi:hypothetical protein
LIAVRKLGATAVAVRVSTEAEASVEPAAVGLVVTQAGEPVWTEALVSPQDEIEELAAAQDDIVAVENDSVAAPAEAVVAVRDGTAAAVVEPDESPAAQVELVVDQACYPDVRVWSAAARVVADRVAHRDDCPGGRVSSEVGLVVADLGDLPVAQA